MYVHQQNNVNLNSASSMNTEIESKNCEYRAENQKLKKKKKKIGWWYLFFFQVALQTQHPQLLKYWGVHIILILNIKLGSSRALFMEYCKETNWLQ